MVELLGCLVCWEVEVLDEVGGCEVAEFVYGFPRGTFGSIMRHLSGRCRIRTGDPLRVKQVL